MSFGKLRCLLIGAALLGSGAAYSQVADTVVDICATPAAKKAIHAALKTALTTARNQANGGFNLDMWGTVVNRDGVVCAVAFTGTDRDDQWPGSRVISAQKANTANSFSLAGLALSTANLWEATQNGGSLFGLQHSNPVDTAVAYDAPSSDFGTDQDPMAGQKIGGVNVFGGGLALYNNKGVIVGAIGVSGDSSCADHNIAWRVRNLAGLDYVTNGVAPAADGGTSDNIIYADPVTNKTPGGFGHPECAPGVKAISAALPQVKRVP
jgi:uncharacterized protein GlcG (DUF336 family)